MGCGGRYVNYWMIAAAVLAVILLTETVFWLRARAAHRRALAQLQQESEQLRGENISLRREVAARERDVEAEQAHSDSLAVEIEQLQDELAQFADRVQRAEARRTDAEKEMFATRMRIDQLQQQLHQSHTEQINQEKLYQDIISERDRTISTLQDKLHKRRKKKKEDVLDRQITLDDILNGADQ